MLRPNRVGEREHLDDAASPAEIAAAAAPYPRALDHDLPLCSMPAGRARELHAQRSAVRALERQLHLWDLGLRDDSEDAVVRAERSALFPAPCQRCALKSGCPGVLRAHLERFGESALTPFQS
jgi:hypothetical protein